MLPGMKPSASLMIQGTTSDAGKSTVVTGLCRLLQRDGVKVAPFKPQNMALNSYVTPEGREIGRAQAVQAQACGLEPHTDMNPILLKPSTDTGAQVIVHGRALSNMEARCYHDYKPRAMQAVLESWQRLGEQYQAIIVEGAGSPAEINLREGDIANMGFAEAVDCPVLLVADIDRGGVFATIVGTLELLSESERARVKGIIINRFRGDVSLLQSGIDWLENRINKPVLGVLPMLKNFHLEAEDAINTHQSGVQENAFSIVVPVLPRIGNHTDFDPLRLLPEVNLQFVGLDHVIPPADLIILPGAKNTCADLMALLDHGWDQAINRHLRHGGKLLGICGGYQMLGKAIHDPLGIEGKPGGMAGLGLLDLETTMNADKTLTRRSGALAADGAAITGYEVHNGITEGPALAQPFIRAGDHTDGAVSPDGQVIGTYWHGLFESAEACHSILQWAGLKTVETMDYHALKEREIDRLADMMEEHLDMAEVRKLLG